MNTSKKTFALSSLTLRILTLGCFATAAFFGLRSTWSQPPQLLPTVTADSNPIVPSIQSPPSLETQNIEDIRLGQRVVGTNPLREQTQPASDIDLATWRAVRLNMIQGGIEYDLAFLRPLSWIEATGAEVGRSIHMELHEMGLDGPAQVVAIEPCPEIEQDDGTGRNVVTGTMAHPGPNILYLDITGLDELLGVTDTHPIWSETHQHFVKAGQLEIGEKLQTLTGAPSTLTAIHPHPGLPKMVFNLEVDAEHVYNVSNSGVLVHNDCLYHGTDADSADDIIRNGLDAKAAATVDAGWDDKGLSLTRDPAVAKQWADGKALLRGKAPAVVRVRADLVPARAADADEYWGAGEMIIEQIDFSEIVGGIFELFE